MNAPPFLTLILSALMLLMSVYSAWRLVIARAWGRTVDYEADVLHFAAGFAVAYMLASWAHTLPRPAWTALFSVGIAYFALRTARGWNDTVERGRQSTRAAVCAVLVYMLTAGVAPSTIIGTSAGKYTMAGMPGMSIDTTITFPAIGCIAVVGLAFYAVAVLARLSPEGGAAVAVGGPGDGALLAPRSVDVCRIALVAVMAYAILTKLV